jgi:hypothetical protein
MHSEEIDELFRQVAPDTTVGDDEGVRQVFETLVETTLTYRDQLKKGHEFILTVEDVGVVLDWLMAYMQTGNGPDTDNDIRAELFRLWLVALTPKRA